MAYESPTDALAALRSEATKLQERYVDDEYDARSAWRLVTDCYKWMNDALALAATLVEERDLDLAVMQMGVLRAEHARLDAELSRWRKIASDPDVIVNEVTRLDAENRRLLECRDLMDNWARKVVEALEALRPHAERLGLPLGGWLHDGVPLIVAENAKLRAETAGLVKAALRLAADFKARGIVKHYHPTAQAFVAALAPFASESSGGGARNG